MFAAQNAVFKELLREQRKCYDGALSAVMNEILIALGESEVGAAGVRLDSLEERVESLEKKALTESVQVVKTIPAGPADTAAADPTKKLPKMPSFVSKTLFSS